MLTNRILRITLLISLFIHGVILLQNSNLNPFSPAVKSQKIEVRYIKEKPQSKPLAKNLISPNLMRSLPKNEEFLKLDDKAITERVPPPYIEPVSAAGETLKNLSSEAIKRSRALSNKDIVFSRPNFSTPEILVQKKRISLPAIDMARINNPSYISYYQIVREKIRRSAYQNYTRNLTGEAYISFIISNDGVIKDVRLVEEKTTAVTYLKDIAISSVKDASPFPSFPKELDYPQLSFNIIISFEIE